MENKLQELTDRLFNEGLSKGREEGEAILAKARKEAADIVAEAQKQAADITAQAEKEAQAYKTKVSGDVKMAAAQSLQATKQTIGDLIVYKMSAQPVAEALSDKDFIKEIIKAVAARFSAEESTDLSLVLPESLKSELEPFVGSELSKILGRGVSASFSKKITGGFTIGPKDGRYFISFTEDTFKELISAYLRPAVKAALFGE